MSNPNQIIQVKDNGVFSAWNYASKVSGGKRRVKNTRRYKRGKIGKGRRTRRRI
jgi:hypothetical protein